MGSPTLEATARYVLALECYMGTLTELWSDEKEQTCGALVTARTLATEKDVIETLAFAEK